MNPHASRVDIVAINTNPQLVIWLAQFHHTLWRLGFLSPRGPRRQGRTQCVGGSGSGTRGAGGPANQVHQDVVVVEAQQVQDHVHCECVSTRQCNHQLQSCKVLHSIFGLLTRGLFQFQTTGTIWSLEALAQSCTTGTTRYTDFQKFDYVMKHKTGFKKYILYVCMTCMICRSYI